MRPTGPSLSFPIPERLRGEACEVIVLLREDPTPKAHVPRLVELISELTDSGLHACYYVPVERMGVNLVARSSVRLGLKAAERSMFPVMRRIVEGLSEDQLRTLADFLEELVGVGEPRREPEAAEAHGQPRERRP